MDDPNIEFAKIVKAGSGGGEIVAACIKLRIPVSRVTSTHSIAYICGPISSSSVSSSQYPVLSNNFTPQQENKIDINCILGILLWCSP